MNPSSDISSLENQFAPDLINLNQLLEKKDYKALFEKLFDLVLYLPDRELTLYQRQLKSLEILIITKIFFDKILGNNIDNFVFYEDNLVEKFNQGIKFFKSQGVSQKNLDRFSISLNMLCKFVGDINYGKKRPLKKLNEKTIDKDSLNSLCLLYVVFLLNPPNYLKPYLKRDTKHYIPISRTKKTKDLPLLLLDDQSFIPNLPSILMGHSHYQLDYLALRKLMLESYKTRDPLTLRSPIKLLGIFDSDFLKSPQLFDFFAKMACDSDKKTQFKFYKSLIVNESLSKAFLEYLYRSFSKRQDSKSLVELAIKNNNTEFLKTALKFGFKPNLFKIKTNHQELSAKALAIRDGSIEVFKILFDEKPTKTPSQTEISPANGEKITFFNDLELAFAYERFDILKYLSQSEISKHIMSPPPDQVNADCSLNEELPIAPKTTKPFQFYDREQKTFLSFEDYFNNFLTYAVITNDPVLFKILIIDFEDIIKDEYKINALYYAITMNRPEMLGILVQKKVSEYIEQNLRSGLTDRLELIVNLDDQLSCQLTPLQLSVLYSSYESMQILLDLGCSIDKKSANKESALSLAEKLEDAYTLEILKNCNIKQTSHLKDKEKRKIYAELIRSLTTDLDPSKFQTTKSNKKSFMFDQQSKWQNLIKYFYLKTQCRILGYEIIANSIFKSYENFKKTFDTKEFFLYNKFLRENLLMLLTSIRLASTNTQKKIKHQELAKSYFMRTTRFNLYCMLTLVTNFKPIIQEKFIDNDCAVFLFADLVLARLYQPRLENPRQAVLSSNLFPIDYAKTKEIRDSLSDYFKVKFDDWLDKFQHYLAIDQELSSGRTICKKTKNKFFQEEDRIVIMALGDFFKIALSLERYEIDLPKTKDLNYLDHFSKNPSELAKIKEIARQFCQSGNPSLTVRTSNTTTLSKGDKKIRTAD